MWVTGAIEEYTPRDQSRGAYKNKRRLFIDQQEDEAENAHGFRECHKDHAHDQYAVESAGIASDGFRRATADEADADGCAATGETEGKAGDIHDGRSSFGEE